MKIISCHLSCLFLFFFISISTAVAQDWNQIIKTASQHRNGGSPSGRAAGDQFGLRVAMSGDYAVVGGRWEDEDAAGGNTLNDSGAAYVLKRDIVTGNWRVVRKLVASDRAAGDNFGTAVAIDGEDIVVGARLESEDASGGATLSGAGSAYIFSRNQGGADNWGQVKKLVALDRAAGDNFGIAVASSGGHIVVGAYQKDGSAGAAYVFGRNQGGANNWGQVKKLVALDREAGDYFGYAVSISDDYIVVGAYYSQAQDASGGATMYGAGSAYVFGRNQGGTDNWGHVKKLVAADRSANDLFGTTVAISGEYIVVGAYGDNDDANGGNPVNRAGSAYVFVRNQGGIDNWGQVKKLLADDREKDGYFGYAVSISGDHIVVGAFLKTEGAALNAGVAYVLGRNQGGTNNWGQVKKLLSNDLATNDYFGVSVAISGGHIIVGAYQEDEDASGGATLSGAGSAYVFSIDQGGAANWGQAGKIVAVEASTNQWYGYSVSIDGDYAVVGAPQEATDANGGNVITGSGTVHVLHYSGGSWSQVKKLVASDRAIGDSFGAAVSISGDYIVVGAYQEDENASGGATLSGAGSAYVFGRNQGGADNWGQVRKLVASDRAANDTFGRSVSISGDYIVVGANEEDEDVSGGATLSGAGSAYVFGRNQGGADNWGQVRKLVASDRAANDSFGWSVSISGDYIVVGAHLEDEDASGGSTLPDAGSAYVFGRNQGGADNWGQVKKLVATDRAAGDNFGWSVSINGDYIAVGAHLEDEDASGGSTLSDAGSAYVFGRNQGGADNWGQVKKLVASDRGAGDYFGWSVSISGDYILVGAHLEDEDASGGSTLPDAGSAYVFGRNQGGADNWGQVKKLVASDRGTGDNFGYAVALSGNNIVAGAYQEDEDAFGGNTILNSGSAYFFGGITTLPVGMGRFVAKAQYNAVALAWQTTNEQHNKEFLLSHSADGTNFTILASIAGAGSSSSLKKYSYTDRSPLNGTNYYKLEQVDGDGTVNLVGVEVVNFKLSVSAVTVYPNPTANEINLTIPTDFGKTIKVTMLDALGRTVHAEIIKKTEGQASYKLNNSKLPSGQYIIRLNSEQKTESLKLLVK